MLLFYSTSSRHQSGDDVSFIGWFLWKWLFSSRQLKQSATKFILFVVHWIHHASVQWLNWTVNHSLQAKTQLNSIVQFNKQQSSQQCLERRISVVLIVKLAALHVLYKHNDGNKRHDNGSHRLDKKSNIRSCKSGAVGSCIQQSSG